MTEKSQAIQQVDASGINPTQSRTAMRAICFYSNRSDADWYKYDLELIREQPTIDGSDFEKHEYLSVVISKDITKPLMMLTHEYGTSGTINHWARTVEELVHDYQYGIHKRQNYQFVPVADYMRLRRDVLVLIDQHKESTLNLLAYQDAFEFVSQRKELDESTESLRESAS